MGNSKEGVRLWAIEFGNEFRFMVKLSSSGRHARSTATSATTPPAALTPNNIAGLAAYHAGVLQDIATVEEASSTIENKNSALVAACWWAANNARPIKGMANSISLRRLFHCD